MDLRKALEQAEKGRMMARDQSGFAIAKAILAGIVTKDVVSGLPKLGTIVDECLDDLKDDEGSKSRPRVLLSLSEWAGRDDVVGEVSNALIKMAA